MNECVTAPDILALIEAMEPLFTYLAAFAGYGLISLFSDVFSYIDRVWFGHVEPCPCSLIQRDEGEL
ncbi:MAG: hypothetical protein CL552_08885 [Alcanivorax sp.]|jgi:hypothetical protein|uniref:hypothetical protein n=1 Tax=Alcanivorax TaxID=59753 RepID=UPI000C3B9819|nr:hypothetical protein [Alcanivorax sp.]MBG33193.1 hypothetical protein [Alcanivorax sp.]|tara:strand:+ start:11425 stop:11625 length:201 start_codon:yes stop_codon:yes gene_type:complete